jgi:hypothetical protein
MNKIIIEHHHLTFLSVTEVMQLLQMLEQALKVSLFADRVE